MPLYLKHVKRTGGIFSEVSLCLKLNPNNSSPWTFINAFLSHASIDISLVSWVGGAIVFEIQLWYTILRIALNILLVWKMSRLPESMQLHNLLNSPSSGGLASHSTFFGTDKYPRHTSFPVQPGSYSLCHTALANLVVYFKSTLPKPSGLLPVSISVEHPRSEQIKNTK